MADETKTIKAHCNKCLGERNHLVLHEERQAWDDLVDDRYAISGAETFRMLKCGGCDSVNLQLSSWFSEDTDEYGRPHVSVTYYPPAISKSEPAWLGELEWPLGASDETYIVALLREIYSALHNDSRKLAVMGVRALLEHVMISSVGDKGSFKANLDAYETAGFLSKKQREIVEPILEAGHATIHRGYSPSSEDVSTVVEIAEGLIETTIIHPRQASKLKKRVPKKKKKKKKKMQSYTTQ